MSLSLMSQVPMQMDSDLLQEACLCLEASTAALSVMSAPQMPTSVLNEAVIQPVAESIKHHLLVNILSNPHTRANPPGLLLGPK